MRDIIWTIIVIWFVYKLVDIFRSGSVKKNGSDNSNEGHINYTESGKNKQVKRNLDDEGEYVDYEEVK